MCSSDLIFTISKEKFLQNLFLFLEKSPKTEAEKTKNDDMKNPCSRHSFLSFT